MPDDVRLGYIDTKAAKFAVEHWHYSKRMPVGKMVKIGVWEHDEFVGAVIFSWGASPSLSKQFGLKMTECVELVRVAMRSHDVPVTYVVAEAMRMMKAGSPGVRVVVSFADPEHGHVGRIYQAGNWLYLGESNPSKIWRDRQGVTLHIRAYSGRQFGGVGNRSTLPPGATSHTVPGKHRYAMPLDKSMRRQLVKRAMPYPQPTSS